MNQITSEDKGNIILAFKNAFCELYQIDPVSDEFLEVGSLDDANDVSVVALPNREMEVALEMVSPYSKAGVGVLKKVSIGAPGKEKSPASIEKAAEVLCASIEKLVVDKQLSPLNHAHEVVGVSRDLKSFIETSFQQNWGLRIYIGMLGQQIWVSARAPNDDPLSVENKFGAGKLEGLSILEGDDVLTMDWTTSSE
tara:strand:+ start:6592 stop:7179 length:588 start_codon:yes stop_codon:yes gene_type:complete